MNKVFATMLSLLTLAFAYPLAAISTHGLNFVVWPEGVDTPSHWYLQIVRTFGQRLIETYWDMLLGRSPAFAGGGQAQLAAVFLPAFALSLLLTSGKPQGPLRALTPVYGDARFATTRERRRMKVGLELGTDPHSGRTIRIAVKGNLTSIAPPGSGKSSGLLFPNLAAPENSAWFGPAVVIDPKGDSYRAVGERRRRLGRAIHCLDPMGLVGGDALWNPLSKLDPGNIIYLQRTAEALLPASGANETQYFREAANSIIVAAFLAAHREGQATPRRIAELLADRPAFAKALDGVDAVSARSTLSLIQDPPKNIADLFTTAQQAFRWSEDPRLAALTAESSFELKSICDGEADLFLTLPTEDIKRLSPLIRWLLTDLFATIRRHKPRERIIVFIDEAKAIGFFDEILTGYGEMPGYNVSLWTFWQNRPQIVEIYGENGAKDLLSNSEVLTLADVPQADPDSLDLWSRAIGEYTMIEESKTVTEKTSTQPGSVSTGTTFKAVRLMPPEKLGSLPQSDLVAMLNSQNYASHPLIIRKTRYDDRRLQGVVQDIGGRAESV